MNTPLQTACSSTGKQASRFAGWMKVVLAGGVYTGIMFSSTGLAREYSELLADNIQLKRQNSALSESLVEANRREQESAKALAEIKTRLEALGKNLVDGKDDRMVKALSDIQVLHKQVQSVEESALKLSHTVQDYLKTALHANPAQRAKVEVALRELDVSLGMRSKPNRSIQLGALDSARVISVDSQTGLIVLNAGNQSGAQIGMKFKISRNNESVAEVLIAETRENISGALIQTLTQQDSHPQVGDRAVVQLQKNR